MFSTGKVMSKCEQYTLVPINDYHLVPDEDAMSEDLELTPTPRDDEFIPNWSDLPRDVIIIILGQVNKSNHEWCISRISYRNKFPIPVSYVDIPEMKSYELFHYHSHKTLLREIKVVNKYCADKRKPYKPKTMTRKYMKRHVKDMVMIFTIY